MYRKNGKSWIKHWDFELFDILFLEVAFLISYVIRHKEYISSAQPMYMRYCILLVLFDVVVVLFSHNYNQILQRNIVKEAVAVIQHVTMVELLLLLYVYVIKEADMFSRTVFLLSWGMGTIFCFSERVIWKQIVRRKLSTEKNQTNMLVITSVERANKCINDIMQKEFRDFKIVRLAIIDEKSERKEFDHRIKAIYGQEEMIDYIRNNVVDEVCIDTFNDNASLSELVNLFLSMGITVHIGMGFLPEGLPNKFMEKLGNSNVITSSIKTASPIELAIKRLVDIIGAVVGLILTAIAFIFVAPAIKKASPGPVFFKQERVGKNGRKFFMFKFRSMYMDAEERKKELLEKNEMDGFMFKMENDPRIIGSEKGKGKGIGNFIRKTSIDELPQFWNILIGEMSLVGTRPPTVNEVMEYDLHHRIRLSMKPGLTGMWQVSGRSEITDFDEVVRLDTKYIENWSLLLDFKILCKTVKVVLCKEGSK